MDAASCSFTHPRAKDGEPAGLTVAVTGPPPRDYDFKTRVIGGSRSPHGYRTSTCCGLLRTLGLY